MAKLTLNLSDIQGGHLPRVCIFTGSLKQVELHPLRVPGERSPALRWTQLAVTGLVALAAWGLLGRSFLYLAFASSAVVEGLWRLLDVPAFDQIELRLPATAQGVETAERFEQADPWMQLVGGGAFCLLITAFMFQGPLVELGGATLIALLGVVLLLLMAGALLWLSQRRESTIKLVEQTPGSVILEVPTAVERAYRNAFACPKVEPAPTPLPEPAPPRID